MVPTVDVGVLARGTTGFSGAELANLVNMAAIRAAVTGAEKIDEGLLDWARDRVLMGAERTSAVISEENKRLTAYHEGGHAIVALRTDGAMPLHKATITPRGNSLGMVTQLPDKDETSVSLRQMRARLDVCMGGRVAEEARGRAQLIADAPQCLCSVLLPGNPFGARGYPPCPRACAACSAP